MPLKLTNNAVSLLAAPIDAVATTINITSGDESLFPTAAPAGPDYFPVTVIDSQGNREIMRCDGRTGVNLHVARGQEGTTARAFPINSRVEVRLTAAALLEQTSNASALTTGTLPDARLPDRLKPWEMQLGAISLNTITESGRYWCDPATTGQPIASSYGWAWADVVNAGIQYQEWQLYNGTRRFRRQMVATLWGAWEEMFSAAPDAIPVGAIMDFAGATTVPAGWLLCYGQVLTRGSAGPPPSIYWNLFQVIGTSFGSNTGSDFLLPDYRGRVAAGKDNMGGVSANRLTLPSGATVNGINGDILGAVGGLELHAMTELQMPAHNHTIVNSLGHTHDVQGYISGGGSTSGIARLSGSGGSGAALANQALSDGVHTHTMNDAGSGIGHNNVQPTIILNKIIKYA